MPLESFPETTAVALAGLPGRDGVAPSIARAREWSREAVSPLAAAWLRLALRLHHEPVAVQERARSDDVLLTAIECLSATPECANLLWFRSAR